MSERVLYGWTDALGDEWQLIDGPRPMGMGFQRRSAGSGWEWVPSTPSAVPDLAKAMLGLLCETRRLRALYDGERLLRERESARLAARVTELEEENAKLRADAERWRYCADIGEFPILQHLPGDKRWGMWRQGAHVEAATPEAALDAARAEVKP